MIPVCFEYVDEDVLPCKIFVTILNQFKHHYTGETIYHVREEGEPSWTKESFYNEFDMQEALSKRVTEADK